VTKEKNRYAWIILIGCCALTAGTGLVLNTCGQWFVSVTTELEVGTAQLALFVTILGICMAIASPFVGKFMAKYNLRLLLTGCWLVVLLGLAAMSFYTEVWHWYISGAIMGFAGAFCFLIPAPVILGNWFMKRNGLAVGIAMSFSGISAAIANPIFAAAISNFGWRTAYLIAAVTVAVIVFPSTLFVLRFKPADKGLKPYGYEETSEEKSSSSAGTAAITVTGVSSKTAFRSPSFWLLFAMSSFFMFLAGFAQLMPSYVSSVGLLGIVGFVATMSMVGNLTGKLGLGAISDKLGGRRSSVIGLTLVTIGFLLLILGGAKEIFALSGALFYGVSLSLASVASPILVREAFGVKDFGNIYSKINIGISAIGAIGTTVVGLIYDLAGSFIPAFWSGIGLCIVCAILMLTGLALARRLPQDA